MKWMTLKDAAALCIAAAFTMLAAAPAYAEKRVALVIGNNDYKNVPRLQKAVNDARTRGDTLKQLGFTVMVAENQTRQAFSESLLAFDKAVDKGDTAFFFYAGHGFCCRPMSRRRPKARKSWYATPRSLPTASSSACRTRAPAPPFSCSTPAVTTRSSVAAPARSRVVAALHR